MTPTVATITPQFQRPSPIPFDFVGTAHFIEKLDIIEKKEGVSLPAGTPFTSGIGYAAPAYFIFVMTRFGDMRMTVSEKMFQLLDLGDKVVVDYRKGRWTGALEGKFAK